MSAKTTMCILFRDETVDAVFIDRTMFGAQIKFMEQLPREELVFEEIAKLMRSVEKTPARVLLCVPRELAMQRTLRYPAMAPADIANMIQFEATRHVPLPEADRALGWAAVEAAEEKQVVLNLVAARDTDIRELVGRFEEVGVPIDEALPFSTALYSELGSAPTLLVVADARHVELCLYGEGQLQDSQLIPLNAPGYSPERVLTAARQMVVKHRDWLGMEGIGRVLLTGAARLSESFEADLGATFGLNVQPLALPEALAAVEDPLTDALLAASSELPMDLNLIEQSGRKVPISKRTIVITALCALLAIELVAWFGFKTAAPALQRKQVAEEMAKIRRRAAPIQRMQDRNREMRKQLYRLDDICNLHVSAMQVLGGLSELLPEDSYLYSLYYRNGTLYIRGHSKEPDRLPGLLQDSPYIEGISKSDIGKKEGDYHSISMTVTLRSPDEETDI
jgi:cell division protein FtsB